MQWLEHKGKWFNQILSSSTDQNMQQIGDKDGQGLDIDEPWPRRLRTPYETLIEGCRLPSGAGFSQDHIPSRQLVAPGHLPGHVKAKTGYGPL